VSEPIAIIGDVHGDADRLARAMKDVRSLNRRVVLVGDYVNRGPDSSGVLQSLVAARADFGSQLVLIRGNHELALADYLDQGDLPKFARFGGLATIRSYVGVARPDVHAHFLSRFPKQHERLIRDDLVAYFETDGLLVSHAGFDPANPDDRSDMALTISHHPGLFEWAKMGGRLPRPMVVCGHYVQRNLKPYDQDGVVCLDTGCGTMAGPLTMLLLPEHKFVAL
jgi:serine/threonine protein phosphatase 1